MHIFCLFLLFLKDIYCLLSCVQKTHFSCPLLFLVMVRDFNRSRFPIIFYAGHSCIVDRIDGFLRNLWDSHYNIVIKKKL